MINIFDSLVHEIDRAVAERGFLTVCHRATELGLNGGQIDLSSAVGYRYEGLVSGGETLSLYARSYDPSGPTQVRPGITRFTVVATDSGAVTHQYENEYEGIVRP